QRPDRPRENEPPRGPWSARDRTVVPDAADCGNPALGLPGSFAHGRPRPCRRDLPDAPGGPADGRAARRRSLAVGGRARRVGAGDRVRLARSGDREWRPERAAQLHRWRRGSSLSGASLVAHPVSQAPRPAEPAPPGPHREALTTDIDGVDARASGSRGQQRLVALALRLAEMLPVTDAAGTTPVLLLDDALSELDPAAREQIVRELAAAEQVFLTAPEPLTVKGAAVFSVNAGGVASA